MLCCSRWPRRRARAQDTLPLPIVLVVGGAALSFLPGLSDLKLDPDVFLLLFVPLLLFGDGWQLPKREFVSYLRPILLLALGLVAATVVVVGYLMHWLIPSLPLAAAFALGAIVSPTDAVATAPSPSDCRCRRASTNIVNGESLINDASGLVAFKFAVAAVATGFLLVEAARRACAPRRRRRARGARRRGRRSARCASRLMRFGVDDPTMQTMLSLLTPYAAYLVAERLCSAGHPRRRARGLVRRLHDTRRWRRGRAGMGGRCGQWCCTS